MDISWTPGTPAREPDTPRVLSAAAAKLVSLVLQVKHADEKSTRAGEAWSASTPSTTPPPGCHVDIQTLLALLEQERAIMNQSSGAMLGPVEPVSCLARLRTDGEDDDEEEGEEDGESVERAAQGDTAIVVEIQQGLTSSGRLQAVAVAQQVAPSLRESNKAKRQHGCSGIPSKAALRCAIFAVAAIALVSVLVSVIDAGPRAAGGPGGKVGQDDDGGAADAGANEDVDAGAGAGAGGDGHGAPPSFSPQTSFAVQTTTPTPQHVQIDANQAPSPQGHTHTRTQTHTHTHTHKQTHTHTHTHTHTQTYTRTHTHA